MVRVRCYTVLPLSILFAQRRVSEMLDRMCRPPDAQPAAAAPAQRQSFELPQRQQPAVTLAAPTRGAPAGLPPAQQQAVVRRAFHHAGCRMHTVERVAQSFSAASHFNTTVADRKLVLCYRCSRSWPCRPISSGKRSSHSGCADPPISLLLYDASCLFPDKWYD